MADFFDTYNDVDGELTCVSSLLTAALCVREHQPDLRVISDLLYLIEKKVKIAKGLVRKMHEEHNKLEKGMEKPSAIPTRKEGEF